MEQNIKQSVLKSIGTIYERAKDSKLNESFFEEISSELDYLSDYFKITYTQALFVATVFSLNYKGERVDLSSLINYFDCNPMKILEYSDDFIFLIEKGILIKEDSLLRLVKLELANEKFAVNKAISKAILNNKSMPTIVPYEPVDELDLLDKIHDFGSLRFYDELTTVELLTQTNDLLNEYSDLPLIQEINNYQLSIIDKYIYIYTISRIISGHKSVEVVWIMECLFDNKRVKNCYLYDILSSENSLIKDNYLELFDQDNISNTAFKLSKTTIANLEKHGIKVFINSH